MTKAELVNHVAETKGLEVTKKAVRKEHRFAYPGFGTFSIRTRRARMGVNPQTKKPIKIPATKTVGFKPAPSFKKGL